MVAVENGTQAEVLESCVPSQLLCAGGSKRGAGTHSKLMLDDRSFGRAWEKCDLELMLTRKSLDS